MLTNLEIEASALCTACLAIFQSTTEPSILEKDTILPRAPGRQQHHQSISALIRAADAQCFICSAVRSELSVAAASVQETDEPATSSLVINEDSEVRIIIFLNVPASCPVISFDTAKGSSNMQPPTHSFSFQLPPLTLNLVHPDEHGQFPVRKANQSVHKWVSRCCLSEEGIERHKSCREYRLRSGTKLKTPIRLVQLEKRDLDDKCWFRVVECQHLGPDQAYATVSHPSLVGQPGVLAEGGDVDFSSWNNTKCLPACLDRSSRVALAAGVQYIWIPALCDNKASHDSERASIFASGRFNIALIDVDPSFEGTAGGLDQFPIVQPRWNPKENLLLYRKKAFQESIMQSPLWASTTFHQDVILSAATVYCCGDQFWWQCLGYRGAILSEALQAETMRESTGGLEIDGKERLVYDIPGIYGRDPKGIAELAMAGSTGETAQGAITTADPTHAENAAPFTEALVASWTSLVPSLSNSRADSLTSKTKMIQSIARGVLRIPNRGTGVGPSPLRFTHGCWSAGLVTQLAWHSDNRFPVLHDLPAARRQDQERTPTWSWLSIPAAVSYDFPITTVPGVFCTYLQPGNSFQKPRATARLANGGPLEDAVEIRGYILPIDAIDLQSDITRDTSSRHGHQGVTAVIWDTREERDRVQRLDSLVVKDTYRFWPIYAQTFLHTDSLESRGIVLRRIDVPGPQDGAFVRCGWVSYRFENLSTGSSHGNLPSLRKIEAGQDGMTQEFRVL